MDKNKVMANMLNMLVSTIGGELKDVKPKNNVALFVDNSIDILFVFPESDTTSEFGFMLNIISKVFILSANVDPQQTLEKFNKFTSSYITWVRENSSLSLPDIVDESCKEE